MSEGPYIPEKARMTAFHSDGTKPNKTKEITALDVFREVVCDEESIADYLKDFEAVMRDVTTSMNDLGYILYLEQSGPRGRWRAAFRRSATEYPTWYNADSVASAISVSAVETLRRRKS